jgi:hypothetical protein
VCEHNRFALTENETMLGVFEVVMLFADQERPGEGEIGG